MSRKLGAIHINQLCEPKLILIETNVVGTKSCFTYFFFENKLRLKWMI